VNLDADINLHSGGQLQYDKYWFFYIPFSQHFNEMNLRSFSSGREKENEYN